MKPAPFRYERPASLDEALGLLAGDDGLEVRPLAGGQSLVPLMNLRMARPEVVVDLNRVPELSGIERRGDRIRLGALTRHETLATDPTVVTALPLLARAASHIGHRAIRTRGTLGGSLAHADPSAELPVASLALGAEVELASASGTRTLAVTELFTGPLSTALDEGELIVAVHVPVEIGRRPFGFAEIARRHGDFAVALAAVTVATDADGGCRAASIAVGGIGGTPRLVGAAARTLIGTRLDRAAVDRAGDEVAAAVRPTGDLHGSGPYRRAMAALLTRRALDEARGATVAR
jgi:carbon-monoxide dehydrogenase medium subunit